jgi:phosphoglycolate phosphatase
MEKLVLFDIDGTLMKESPTHTFSFEYACKKIFNVDVDIYSFPRHGMTDTGIIYGLLHKAGITDSEISSEIGNTIDLISDYVEENIKKEDYELLPGVIETLEELSNHGITIGTITGNAERVAKIRVEKAGIGKYLMFGGFGSDDLNRANLVKIAIERSAVDVCKPQCVFVVGDTPLDIIAAHQANTMAVAVATGSFGIESLNEADLVLNNLNETKKFMEYLKIK